MEKRISTGICRKVEAVESGSMLSQWIETTKCFAIMEYSDMSAVSGFYTQHTKGKAMCIAKPWILHVPMVSRTL